MTDTKTTTSPLVQHATTLVKLRDRLYALEDEIAKISRSVNFILDSVLENAGHYDSQPHRRPPVHLTDAEYEALEYLLERRAIACPDDATVLQELLKRIVT